jgi:menaquinone-dependent protoporphyrinogen oxidase
MADRVLVAYASKYGATEGIAEKIGEILREEGLEVDVLQAKQVGDLTQYDAFVIGSAVYIGQWRKEASNFLKKNENLIAGKPVWLFSSGPLGEGDAIELMEGWQYPTQLQPVIDRIKPRDTTVFSGSADTNKMNFFERFIIRMVKAEFGDFRDWHSIESWTKTIAGELKK